MDPTDQLYDLLCEADDLPDGPAKVAVLEAAVGLADSKLTPSDGYYAREPLMDAALRAGRTDLLMTHFAWCLAAFDADPDEYDAQALLWRYKWVANGALHYPAITLTQLDDLYRDMARRFTEYGSGRRAEASAELERAVHRGDKDAAKAHLAAHDAAQRDDLSNCPACEADSAVEAYLFLGQPKRAYKVAEPVLTGRMRCAEVPLNTYCRLLVPLVKLGDAAEAVREYHAAKRLAAKSADAVSPHSDILTFLGVTDNLPTAVRLLNRSLPHALAYGVTPLDRFDYLTAAAFVLRRLADTGSRVKVKLPADHPWAGQPVGEVAAWAGNEAEKLAAEFDARNGTDHNSRRLKATLGLAKQVTPMPLDA